MDVILDANVYISDYRMENIAFKNLFDYLKRTGDSLVLLRIVREEVVAHFARDLKQRANEAKKTWKAYRYLHFPDKLAEFTEPDIAYQKKQVRYKLMKPSTAVAVFYYADTSRISVDNVFIRGIHRIPPANVDGEELRDVIVWLSTLDYAKSKNRKVAFITNDSGFWVNDDVRPNVQEDIKKAGVEVRLYRSIDSFVEENSLDVKAVDGKLANELFPEFIDGVVAAAESALRSRRGLGLGSVVDSVSLKSAQFKEGKLFEVAPNVQVAEMLFSVSVQFQTRTFQNIVPNSILGAQVSYPNSILGAQVSYLEEAFPGLGRHIPFYESLMTPVAGLSQIWAPPSSSSPHVIETQYLMTGTVRAFARIVDGKLSEKEATEFRIEKIDEIKDAMHDHAESKKVGEAGKTLENSLPGKNLAEPSKLPTKQ